MAGGGSDDRAGRPDHHVIGALARRGGYGGEDEGAAAKIQGRSDDDRAGRRKGLHGVVGRAGGTVQPDHARCALTTALVAETTDRFAGSGRARVDPASPSLHLSFRRRRTARIPER